MFREQKPSIELQLLYSRISGGHKLILIMIPARYTRYPTTAVRNPGWNFTNYGVLRYFYLQQQVNCLEGYIKNLQRQIDDINDQTPRNN